MIQPSLFSWTPPSILGPRDGQTFDHKRDGARLNKQAQDVFNLLANGQWYTLDQISYCTNHPQASVSARLRDLRKPKFGGFTVEKRNLGKGTWIYRLTSERG